MVKAKRKRNFLEVKFPLEIIQFYDIHLSTTANLTKYFQFCRISTIESKLPTCCGKLPEIYEMKLKFHFYCFRFLSVFIRFAAVRVGLRWRLFSYLPRRKRCMRSTMTSFASDNEIFSVREWWQLHKRPSLSKNS